MALIQFYVNNEVFVKFLNLRNGDRKEVKKKVREHFKQIMDKVKTK